MTVFYSDHITAFSIYKIFDCQKTEEEKNYNINTLIFTTLLYTHPQLLSSKYPQDTQPDYITYIPFTREQRGGHVLWICPPQSPRPLTLGRLLQQSQPALLCQVLWWFALEALQRQLVVVPARPLRLQIKDDRVNFLERALVLLPHEKLGYLLRELPALFKVDVSIWQTANKEERTNQEQRTLTN